MTETKSGMRYEYRDFNTGKTRYTRGKFMGWTEPTGLIKARYAIFRRKSGDLLVPEYCIPKETRSLLNAQTGVTSC